MISENDLQDLLRDIRSAITNVDTDNEMVARYCKFYELIKWYGEYDENKFKKELTTSGK